MKEDIISIDIVSDIIKAPYTGGRYKGEEVYKVLASIVDKLTPTTLLLIDFQKAHPLDYVFCQYAFGPILKKVQNDSKSTIFKMQSHHKRCFYRGILKYIDKSIPRNTTVEDSKRIFLGTNLFTMISTVDSESIEFLGEISPHDKSILKFINESHSVSEREIIDARKEFQPTIIIESLKSLNKKGFILYPKNGTDKYCSVYKRLNAIMQ